MRVKLSDILEAFELNDRYSEYFLDLETNEVVQVNDMMMMESEKVKSTTGWMSMGSCAFPPPLTSTTMTSWVIS